MVLSNPSNVGFTSKKVAPPQYVQPTREDDTQPVQDQPVSDVLYYDEESQPTYQPSEQYYEIDGKKYRKTGKGYFDVETGEMVWVETSRGLLRKSDLDRGVLWQGETPVQSTDTYEIDGKKYVKIGIGYHDVETGKLVWVETQRGLLKQEDLEKGVYWKGNEPVLITNKIETFNEKLQRSEEFLSKDTKYPGISETFGQIKKTFTTSWLKEKYAAENVVAQKYIRNIIGEKRVERVLSTSERWKKESVETPTPGNNLKSFVGGLTSGALTKPYDVAFSALGGIAVGGIAAKSASMAASGIGTKALIGKAVGTGIKVAGVAYAAYTVADIVGVTEGKIRPVGERAFRAGEITSTQIAPGYAGFKVGYKGPVLLEKKIGFKIEQKQKQQMWETQYEEYIKSGKLKQEDFLYSGTWEKQQAVQDIWLKEHGISSKKYPRLAQEVKRSGGVYIEAPYETTIIQKQKYNAIQIQERKPRPTTKFTSKISGIEAVTSGYIAKLMSYGKSPKPIVTSVEKEDTASIFGVGPSTPSVASVDFTRIFSGSMSGVLTGDGVGSGITLGAASTFDSVSSSKMIAPPPAPLVPILPGISGGSSRRRSGRTKKFTEILPVFKPLEAVFGKTKKKAKKRGRKL